MRAVPELVCLPPADAYALLAGRRPEPTPARWDTDYPMTETLDAIAMLLAAHEAMTGVRVTTRRPLWWIFQIVVDGLVVGDISFHGPPADSSPRTVEVGYGVVPSWRGRGVATRACALVLETAWADGADLVIAETAPGNVASQKVLLSNGFRRRPDGVFMISRRHLQGGPGG